MNSLTLHNFKPIGKALLHRAVGLRDNHIIVHEIPDACKKCPHQTQRQAYSHFPESKEYKKALDTCKHCEFANLRRIADVKDSPVYKEYINEKNRYGYSKSLKFRALLLLLLYHMLCSDSQGILLDLPVEELASLLHCSPKAIRYNNELLVKYEYIYTCKGSAPGTIDVCIRDYSACFLPANKGGRGFFTMSKELFTSLLKLNSTNRLRIFIKVLLDSDTPASETITDAPVQTCTYKDMRLYLPSYCKRNVIQKVLSDVSSDIFTVKTSHLDVTFSLNSLFNAKNVKSNLSLKNKAELKDYVLSVANTIHAALNKNKIPVFHDRFFSFLQNKLLDTNFVYKEIKLSEKQFNELTNLSVQYSVSHVLHAFSEIYFTYICRKRKIHNLGGLIRTTIENHISSGLSAI